MARTPVPLRNRRLAALLAWLVPGLGHVYQGRRGKGILYFVCILGLFLMGMALGGTKVVYWRWLSPLTNPEDFRWWYLAQFWAGLIALPGLIQATLVRYGHDPILGGYLAEPALNVINAMHNRFGRFVDIGIVYTVIAGLLNILAIYDAYDGPALDEDPEPTKTTAGYEPPAASTVKLEPGA